MAKHNRVTLEIGPKGKKVVAVAPDWPGLERGGKSAEDAIEKLRSYIPRYAQVAKLAAMDAAFAAVKKFDIVEQYPGTGSTDFWGISFAFSSIDTQSMSGDELERELALMRACWVFFDTVRGRVSAEMKKGPRGGGRERDHIVRHTLSVEQDWAGGVGVQVPEGEMLTGEGLKAYRDAYCHGIRDYTRKASGPGIGRNGRFGISFGTPLFTRWTTPGRWKTRI
jgi:hypothetical protein